MFKGLRTKIESEQKSLGRINTLQTQANHHTTASNNASSTANYDRDSNYEVSSHRPESSTDSPSNNSKARLESILEGPENVPKSRKSDIVVAQPSLDENNPSASDGQHSHSQHYQALDLLRAEVTQLQERLKSVIKERDDSNNQNAQLNQLIEKLHVNLESEKETKSNLEAKLKEAKTKIADTDHDSIKRGGKQASSKSFDPSMMMTGSAIEIQSDDIEELRRYVMDLQGQINDKNRQLKIRQQNLNDIKRHLQREILDHARTQEELTKVLSQLKQASQAAISSSSESVTPQNGSSLCDIESSKSSSALSNNVSSGITDTRQPLMHGDVFHETARGPEPSAARLQYDNISCISRGSNSVDDNDLQDQYRHGSYNREINNEYLKNVLFRYMTSTDTETTKHLVKALSVMMDFTPEQTAAIKNAMLARSSWLRLK